jgi:hypothetical protein
VNARGLNILAATKLLPLLLALPAIVEAQFSFITNNAPSPSRDTPAPLTSMGITTAGNKILHSWPTSASDYVLQSIANLSSGSWSNVTTGITIVGANYVFTSTMNGKAAFFRLAQ